MPLAPFSCHQVPPALLDFGPPLPPRVGTLPGASVPTDDDAGDVEIACLQLARERGRKTIAGKLTRGERRAAALVVLDEPRPRTRGDCIDGPRPCPWVGCAHHLYLDVNEDNGSIKFNRPELAPWELKESCALDVADRGGLTLEAIAEIWNIVRERVRQVEATALAKVRGTLPPDRERAA